MKRIFHVFVYDWSNPATKLAVHYKATIIADDDEVIFKEFIYHELQKLADAFPDLGQGEIVYQDGEFGQLVLLATFQVNARYEMHNGKTFHVPKIEGKDIAYLEFVA